FHDRLPRLQFAGPLGIFDDSKRKSILHGTQRVERLDLDEQVDARRRQPVYPDYRRVTHRFQDVLEFASHTFPPLADTSIKLRETARRPWHKCMPISAGVSRTIPL